MLSGAGAGGWVERALQDGMHGGHDGRTWRTLLNFGNEAMMNRREALKVIAPPSPGSCIARQAVGVQSPTTPCGNASQRA